MSIMAIDSFSHSASAGSHIFLPSRLHFLILFPFVLFFSSNFFPKCIVWMSIFFLKLKFIFSFHWTNFITAYLQHSPHFFTFLLSSPSFLTHTKDWMQHSHLKGIPHRKSILKWWFSRVFCLYLWMWKVRFFVKLNVCIGQCASSSQWEHVWRESWWKLKNCKWGL